MTGGGSQVVGDGLGVVGCGWVGCGWRWVTGGHWLVMGLGRWVVGGWVVGGVGGSIINYMNLIITIVVTFNLMTLK